MFLLGAPRDASFLPTSPREEGPAPVRATSQDQEVGSDVGPDPFASIDDRRPDRRATAPTAAARRQPSSIEPTTRRSAARDAPAPPGSRGGASGGGGLQVVAGGGHEGAPHRVSMRVLRGRPQAGSPAREDGSGASDGAYLALSEESAGRLAEELVAALAATYPARLARARGDGQWTFHLGDVIDDARADFHRAIGDGLPDGDRLFDAALERLLRGELAPGDDMPPGRAVDEVVHSDAVPDDPVAGDATPDAGPRGA